MARKKPNLDAIVAEIDGWRNAPHFLDMAWPENFRLFHYTSSEGLRGIIETNSIRFSDPLFLNDGSEVYYANSLLRDSLDAFMSGKGRSQRNFSVHIRDFIARTAYIYRPVIFCMSGKPDLLNQWRDYGRDIVPYSIELQPSVLIQQDWNFPCDLVRMIYDREVQNEILQSLFATIYSAVSKNPALLLKRESRSKLMNEILSIVWGVLVLFKNPAFAAEEEWRLLAYAPSLVGQRREFRSSTLGVVPFVSRKPREGTVLPIASVCVGPSPYGYISRMALDTFLQTHGHSCPTMHSEIPSR